MSDLGDLEDTQPTVTEVTYESESAEGEGYDRREIEAWVTEMERKREAGELTEEDIRQLVLSATYFTSHRFELDTTWRTLVLYRNLAIDAGRFEEVALLSAALRWFSDLFEASQIPLPELKDVRGENGHDKPAGTS